MNIVMPVKAAIKVQIFYASAYVTTLSLLVVVVVVMVATALEQIPIEVSPIRDSESIMMDYKIRKRNK